MQLKVAFFFMKNIKRIQSIQLDTKNIYRREQTYVASGVPRLEVVGVCKTAFLPTVEVTS